MNRHVTLMLEQEFSYMNKKIFIILAAFELIDALAIKLLLEFGLSNLCYAAEVLRYIPN